MASTLTFAAALTAASLSPVAKDALAPASTPTLPPTYALHLPTDGNQYFTLELKPGDDTPFKIRPDELLLHTTRNAGGITLADNTDAIIYGGPFNERTLAYTPGSTGSTRLAADRIITFNPDHAAWRPIYIQRYVEDHLVEKSPEPSAAPTLAPDDDPADDN